MLWPCTDGVGQPRLCQGNHDWNFGSPDAFVLDEQDQVVASEGHWVWADEREGHGPVEIRAEAEAGPLAPLYDGRAEEAQAWSADVGGLRFVGIDNSHYQVTPEQTRVLQTALELQPEEGQEVSPFPTAAGHIPRQLLLC